MHIHSAPLAHTYIPLRDSTHVHTRTHSCTFTSGIKHTYAYPTLTHTYTSGMANRTTLVDNNTWNNSHIALVGKAMSSTEDKAYKIMRTLGVDYVLVIFGGMIGYSGDDINKFLWMVRIAEGEHPQDIKVCCFILCIHSTINI